MKNTSCGACNIKSSMTERLTVPLACLAILASNTLVGTGIALADEDVIPGLAGDTSNRIHDTRFKTEVIEVQFKPYEQLELSVTVPSGEPLLYSWKANTGSIYADFHGAPTENVDSYPKNYWIRFEESEDGEGHGAVVAPFTGHHAWFWRNTNDFPVSIRLEISGYYTDHEEVGRKISKP